MRDNGLTEQCFGDNCVYSTEAAVDALLMIVSTGFILLMQCGFAMIENGSIRYKNQQSILIKNMFDACAGALTFWLVGYAFAHAE